MSWIRLLVVVSLRNLSTTGRIYLRLKLNTAFGAVLLTAIWLGGLGATIALFRGTTLEWVPEIYVPVSALVMPFIVRGGKQQSVERRRTPTKTFKEIVLLLGVVAVWMASLLVVLAKLPPKDSYTVSVLAAWVMVMLVAVWRLEKRWSVSSDGGRNSQRDFSNKSVAAPHSNRRDQNRKVEWH